MKKSLIERATGHVHENGPFWGYADFSDPKTTLGVWQCPECGTMNANTAEEAEHMITGGVNEPIAVSPGNHQCANCNPQRQQAAPNPKGLQRQAAREGERYESRAAKIVTGIIEDLPSDYEERPGGPKDPWRKGGHKPLKGLKFTGKRPGDNGKNAPGATKPEEKKHSRFNWKPGS